MRYGPGSALVAAGRHPQRRALPLRLSLAAALCLALTPAVTPVHATWLTALPLTETGTDSETGLNHSPLAYDASGGLHVVWAERDTPGLNYQVYGRHRPWAEWSAAELIVQYADPFPGPDLGAKFPSLFAAGDTLWMAWHDYRHAGIFNAEIYFRGRAVDGTWGPELRITTTQNTSNDGDNGLVPTVVAAGGALHLVWYDFRWNRDQADIFHARRDGSGWTTVLGDSSDVNVSRGVAAGWNSGSPAIAGAPDGSVDVVWEEHRAGVDRIRAARYTPATGFGVAETVSEPGEPLEAPTVALAPDGTLEVVWVQSTAGGRALMSRERAAGGAWGATVLISAPGDLAGDPSLIVTPDGASHLVWQDARLGILDREVFYRRRQPGQPWDASGAADLNLSEASGRSARPSIAADASGNLACVWRDRRSGVFELWLREFRPGGPIAIGGDPAQAMALPALIVAPNPTRGAVWLRRPAGEPISILSVTGRVVGRLPAGARRWDATLADGRRVARGVYLLVGERTGQSTRVCVLR